MVASIKPVARILFRSRPLCRVQVRARAAAAAGGEPQVPVRPDNKIENVCKAAWAGSVFPARPGRPRWHFWIGPWRRCPRSPSGSQPPAGSDPIGCDGTGTIGNRSRPGGRARDHAHFSLIRWLVGGAGSCAPDRGLLGWASRAGRSGRLRSGRLACGSRIHAGSGGCAGPGAFLALGTRMRARAGIIVRLR